MTDIFTSNTPKFDAQMDEIVFSGKFTDYELGIDYEDMFDIAADFAASVVGNKEIFKEEVPQSQRVYVINVLFALFFSIIPFVVLDTEQASELEDMFFNDWTYYLAVRCGEDASAASERIHAVLDLLEDCGTYADMDMARHESYSESELMDTYFDYYIAKLPVRLSPEMWLVLLEELDKIDEVLWWFRDKLERENSTESSDEF